MIAACATVEPGINRSFVESELSLVGFTKSPAEIKTNTELPRESFSPVFNTNREYSFCLVNAVIVPLYYSSKSPQYLIYCHSL